MANWLPKILLGLDDLELIVSSSEIQAEGLNNIYYYIAFAVHMTRNSATAEIVRIGGCNAVQGHSNDSKVINIGTNRKPICDFVMVDNVTYTLTRIVFKLSCSICRIIASENG